MELQQAQQQPAKKPAQTYFAVDTWQKVIAALDERERNYWTTINSRGLPNLWRLNYAQAFGMDPNTRRNATQKLQYAGASDAFVRFRMNITRSHVKQRIQIAMGPRPSFRALAMNDDPGSLAQVGISSKVLDYVFRAAKGEQACFEALESDQWFGEGSIWARWDFEAGDQVPYLAKEPANDQFTGQPLFNPDGTPLLMDVPRTKKSGQPQLSAVFPWEKFADATARVSPWVCVKEKASKFEVAAQYPEVADKILSQQLKRDDPGMVELFCWDWGSVTTDQIVVKHFYHKPCKAVPGGRYLGYVGDVKLWDVPCPLENDMPIVSIRTAKYYGTAFGYPETSDLLAPQEMLDEVTSQTATNLIKHGNQSLWAEDGVEWDQARIAKGGGFFMLKQGQKPPQTIQWAAMPDSAKFLMEWLPSMMSDLSGMNPVVRGQPEANIQSGTFAALMLNIAEKFQSATQGEYDLALNSLGNMLLELVRANADTQFAAEVAGEGNAPYMKFFTREDFNGIRRVIIERQSPLMNNISGRFEVLNAVAQFPKPERGAAVQMLKTGDDAAFTEADMSTKILIRTENARMSKGIPADVSKSDNILLHNPEHQASLDRLRSQEPPTEPMEKQAWEAAIMAHIQHMADHAVVWFDTDPVYLASLNLPMPPMPQVLPANMNGDPAAAMGGGGTPPGAEPKLPNLPEPAQPPAEAATSAAA